jgi:heme-degrading monooxygenase HmoA
MLSKQSRKVGAGKLGEETVMILRKWAARIRTTDEAEYIDYIRETGAAAYLETDGNLGFQILMRKGADGTSEVTTLSWWRDLDAVKRFAGEDYEKSKYYAEDAKFLVEWSEFVEHHEVVVDERG